MNYREATLILGKRDHKKVANNTFLVRRAMFKIGLRLHNTDVLTFVPGATLYDTGGWRTVTTKRRFNDFGPSGVKVWSDKGEWAVYREGEYMEPYFDGFAWYEDADGDPHPRTQVTAGPEGP